MNSVRGIGALFIWSILAACAHAAPSFGSVGGFGDSTLTALVKEAIVKNADPRTATIDLKSALASSQKGRDALLAVGPLDPAPPLGASFDVNWESEVWDRLDASHFPDAVRQSLAAQTAKAWFLAVVAKKEWDMTKRSLSDRLQILQTLQAQFENGEVTDDEVDTAKKNLTVSQQGVQTAETAYREAARSVQFILGRSPADALQATDSLQAVLSPIPSDLPSRMLERRPDVIEAAKQVVAAFTKTALAEPHLPDLPLTASGGVPSDELTDLLEHGLKPIDVAHMTPAQRAAVTQYEKVALNAFHEVGHALDQETALQSWEASLLRTAIEAQAARKKAEARYRKNAKALPEVLTAELKEFETRNAVIVVHAGRLSNRVNLYLALGPVHSSSSSSSVRPFVSGTNFQTNHAAKTPIAP